MRLFYQLVLLLSIFTMAIASIIFVQSFKTSTEYVQNQLYTDSVNTSHWLAMSISMMPNSGDIELMKSMINAVFDGGYYQEISLVDTRGNIIYSRVNVVKVNEVPEWFVNAIEIKNETTSSDIIIDWKRFGELRVYGHTGHAYQQLYHILLELSKTFMWTGIIGFFVLYFLLSYTLSALERIRNQANSVLKNQFLIETKLPFTAELRSVVIAMNAMIQKVKDVFDRENEIMRQYHEALYIDTETFLYNRRYLLAQFPDYIHQDNASIGVYIFFSFDGLEAFEKEYGFHTYNKFIKLFAENMKKTFQSKNQTLITRLNSTDFLLLIPNDYVINIGQLSETVLRSCEQEMNRINIQLKKELILGCSIGNYTSEDTQSLLLSRADQAVIFAKTQGNFYTHIDQTNDNAPIMGREQWRKELQEALDEFRSLFAIQPVIEMLNGNPTIVHEEMWLRLKKKNGELLDPGYFIPVATTLGLSETIDKFMLESLFRYLKQHRNMKSVAINLNRDFICDYSNREWLRRELISFKNHSKTTLSFEVHNNIISSDFESVQALFYMIKNLDFDIGIDHFMLTEEGADYLKEVHPNYIKVNAVYLQDVMLDIDTGKVRSNFTNLLNSAGIEIIVTHLDHEMDMKKLEAMKINRFQGNKIAPVYYS